MFKLPLIIYVPSILLIGLIYILGSTAFTKNIKVHLKGSVLRFLFSAVTFTALYYFC